MPIRDESAELARERERIEAESSGESFDRLEFAQRALALVRPRRTTVALCEGVARVRVTAGRAWESGEGSRWAIVSVPPTASRRAIAVAVAGLATADAAPWSLDVLLRELTQIGGAAPSKPAH